MTDVPVEDFMYDIWDPMIRNTGKAAMCTAIIGTVCHKLQNAFKSSPTETAIKNILPQAYYRALLSCRDGHRIIKAQLDQITQISVIKERLKAEAKTLNREDKLRLWTDVMVQSYAILLVAPPILTTMVVALTLRSAVGLLVHLHMADGGMDKHIFDEDNEVIIVKEKRKTPITDGSVAMTFSSLLGTSAFSQDDADEQLLQTCDYYDSNDIFPSISEGSAYEVGRCGDSAMTGANMVSQTKRRDYLSPIDIINILCDVLPDLIDRARICVMEAIGMLPYTTNEKIEQSETPASIASFDISSCHNCSGNVSSRQSYSEDLHTLSSPVKLSYLEAALREAQERFDNMLDWKANIFGSSSRLFFPNNNNYSSSEQEIICASNHGDNNAASKLVDGNSSTTNQLSEISTRSSTEYTNEYLSQECIKSGPTEQLSAVMPTNTKLSNDTQSCNKSDMPHSAAPDNNTNNISNSMIMGNLGFTDLMMDPEIENPYSIQYRRRTRAYMQDLLTSSEVNDMCKALWAQTSSHWLEVIFFHCPSPAAEYSHRSVTDNTAQQPTSLSDKRNNNSTPRENCSAVPTTSLTTVGLPNQYIRTKEACKSYNPVTDTVTLLQFVVYVDMMRQELLADPLLALEDVGCRLSTKNILMALTEETRDNGTAEDVTSSNNMGTFIFSANSAAATHTSNISSRFDGIVIPACVKRFCSEMISLSGPK